MSQPLSGLDSSYVAFADDPDEPECVSNIRTFPISMDISNGINGGEEGMPLLNSSTGSTQMIDNEDFELLQIRYEEAAIFLTEGDNNIKFEFHPKNLLQLRAYNRVHHWGYNALDLIAGLAILGLAMFERPSLSHPFGILQLVPHEIIELFCLIALAIRIILMCDWLGWRNALKQPRTLIRTLILVGLFAESLVVLFRNKDHFRVLRLLRPYFLIDNPWMANVRRVSRQIVQSMPPIIDMLFLLLFFMSMMAIMGYYLFSSNDQDDGFSTLSAAFVSLFILVTTANYPDVQMPALSSNRWYFVFFLVYLIIGLYCLLNILLAVVYDEFRSQERIKFQKLYLHRRAAIRHAYRLLKDDRYGGIPLDSFRGLMKHRKRRFTPLQVKLMFLALNQSESGAINLRELYNFYMYETLVWKQIKNDDEHHGFFSRYNPMTFRQIRSRIRDAVQHPIFNYGMGFIILLNTCLVFYYAGIVSAEDARQSRYPETQTIDTIFLVVFWLEIVIKFVGLGPWDYLRDNWNRLDLLVTTLSTIGLLLPNSTNIFLSLRQIRMLRLFKVKRRFREGCCGDYYSNATAVDRYYLNNFDDIFNAYVTLFELMIVNNWFVIMNGFVAVTNTWAHAYFMLFYILTVNVVLNVVVAFILESFASQTNFQRSLEDGTAEARADSNVATLGDDGVLEVVQVRLSRSDMDDESEPFGGDDFIRADEEEVVFQGLRHHNMYDCQLLIFHDEIKTWCHEDEVMRSSLEPLIANRGRHIQTLSDSFKRERRLGRYSPLFSNSNKTVMFTTMMGEAIHRLPWVLPSFETQRLHETLDQTDFRVLRQAGSKWPRPSILAAAAPLLHQGSVPSSPTPPTRQTPTRGNASLTPDTSSEVSASSAPPRRSRLHTRSEGAVTGPFATHQLATMAVEPGEDGLRQRSRTQASSDVPLRRLDGSAPLSEQSLMDIILQLRRLPDMDRRSILLALQADHDPIDMVRNQPASLDNESQEDDLDSSTA